MNPPSRMNSTPFGRPPATEIAMVGKFLFEFRSPPTAVVVPPAKAMSWSGSRPFKGRSTTWHPVDNLPDAGTFSLHRGRVALDNHLLRHSAQAQLDIDLGVGPDVQNNVLLQVGAESLGGDLKV